MGRRARARVERGYTTYDITIPEGLEHIRVRPAMYVGDLGPRGLHHLAFTPLHNAVNEALVGTVSRIDVTLLGSALRVDDDGPGIPPAVLERVFTSLAACACGCDGRPGHRRSCAYDVGLPLVNALCARVDVVTRRDGRAWRMSFSRGRTCQRLTDFGPTQRRGTTVTLTPDPRIFGRRRPSLRRVLSRARELVVLAPGLTIHVHDDRGAEPAEPVVLEAPRGAGSLVEWQAGPAVAGAWGQARRESARVSVEVAVQRREGPSRYFGLMNGERCRGAHVDGLRRGVGRCRRGGGVVAAAVVWMDAPRFEGATRERVQDDDGMGDLVEAAARDAVGRLGRQSRTT